MPTATCSNAVLACGHKAEAGQPTQPSNIGRLLLESNVCNSPTACSPYTRTCHATAAGAAGRVCLRRYQPYGVPIQKHLRIPIPITYTVMKPCILLFIAGTPYQRAFKTARHATHVPRAAWSNLCGAFAQRWIQHSGEYQPPPACAVSLPMSVMHTAWHIQPTARHVYLVPPATCQCAVTPGLHPCTPVSKCP